MVWPFKKDKSHLDVANLPVLKFKDGASFFEYQCKYGHTKIENNTAIAALILDSKKEFGTQDSIKIKPSGAQLATLKVASEDGGFVTISETPSSAGERLQPGDIVLWVPHTFSEKIAKQLGDHRRGWVGLIRAKVVPEIDPTNPSFSIVCHYK